MAQTLTQIAEELKNAVHKTKARNEKTHELKAQVIYAFNATGKTRLSLEFTQLISPSADTETRDKILYYNAFTEDLFFWENDGEPKLKIQSNSFIDWILGDEGKEQIVKSHFQRYTNEKLTPDFSLDYSEVTFSFQRGNDESEPNIKISKGEESNFIWSIFYTLIDEVITNLNIPELDDRDTNRFDNLEYIFIDDPVSSLDENHLIDLAIDLSQLIKSSESDVKFIITTHNALFYNVLHNELKNNKYKKYILKKTEDNQYELKSQSSDSPFSYHLYLKGEIEKAIASGEISKYHFNYIRNIFEKTSTFFGNGNWGDLLPESYDEQGNNSYARVINLFSHSKLSSEEIIELTDNHKRILNRLLKHINKIYKPDLKDNLTIEGS